MGLDVYLYRYEDKLATEALEKEYENKSKKIWGPDENYNKMTDAEKEKIRKQTKALAKSMGLNEGGSDTLRTKKIEINSKSHPRHMFKIGYLRSSYNEGGINRILKNSTGRSLDYIFFGDSRQEEYTVQPDWSSALVRAQQVLTQFREWVEKNGKFGVTKVAFNPFGGHEHLPTSEKIALEKFMEVWNQHQQIKDAAKEGKKKGLGDFSRFTSLLGSFCTGGKAMQIRAIMPGIDNFLGKNMPCAYVIEESRGGYKWYVQALEVVVEMIEWVLAQPDKQKYYLHWSG